MIEQRQRLLLRTSDPPKARTAMMMPAAIHWSPGLGKRLKLGIMAQRLYLGVPRCSRRRLYPPTTRWRRTAADKGFEGLAAYALNQQADDVVTESVVPEES